MNSAYTLTDYSQWPWLWAPCFPSSGLFLVRYPGDRLQMTLQLYQTLSHLRLQSLIDASMRQFSQLETHQKMSQALERDATQAPLLQADLALWREAWADSLLVANPRYWQKLETQMERHFPFRFYPPIPSEQERLRSLYSQMQLDDWLRQLA